MKKVIKKLNKQALLKKKLKLRDVPNKRDRKFIIVQIDGLSHKILKNVIKKRYMPFMEKLLNKYNYNINQYDPGYPTTTPFVQAGFMYNDNSNIPGFKFLDKRNQRMFNMALPYSVSIIEEELSRKNYGILTGGTSVGNLISGGANRNIFTISQLYNTETKVSNIRDLLYIVLLNPISGLRVPYFTIREFFVELFESFFEIIGSTLKGKHYNFPFFWPYFPLFRVIINSILREVSTQATLLDMDRGVPYIYLTYAGYDWVSHYRGPKSLSSARVLKETDNSIRKLYWKAIDEGYDFYVLSDHGQVESIPFDGLYHESFDEFVQNATKVKTVRLNLKEKERSNGLKFVNYKMKYYYNNFSLPLRGLTKIMLKMINLRKGKVEKKKDSKLDWQNKKQIIIVDSSSLSHMYFNYVKNRMNISDIEKKHPNLILQIVNHPGIGFVVGKEGNKINVISSKGKIIIDGKNVKYIGERFLREYGDEKKLVKQLTYFAQLKYCGDLIVNGHFDGKKIISFEDFHLGSHDSVGGDQSDAFFVSKENHDLSKVINSKELYDIFIAYHE